MTQIVQQGVKLVRKGQNKSKGRWALQTSHVQWMV